jgi:Na+/H+-dicarboxylate symporter
MPLLAAKILVGFVVGVLIGMTGPHAMVTATALRLVVDHRSPHFVGLIRLCMIRS